MLFCAIFILLNINNPFSAAIKLEQQDQAEEQDISSFASLKCIA